MNKKILLWDLGNVVVRWSPEEIIQLLGYNKEQSLYLRDRFFGHSDWLDLDRGVTTEANVALRLVAEADLSLEQSLRVFDVVRETLTDIEESVSQIVQLADQGVQMYVLSNMSQANADFLKRRNYFSCFRGVVISAEEKLNKPDPELFKRSLKRYTLDPGQVLFIDDTLENIEAARTLGMNGLHFHGSKSCYSKIRQFVGK